MALLVVKSILLIDFLSELPIEFIKPKPGHRTYLIKCLSTLKSNFLQNNPIIRIMNVTNTSNDLLL